MKDFQQKMNKINRFLNVQVFEVVGLEAVSHYRESFRNEGFTDKSLKKWKEVKRRTNPRNNTSADARRPILTGSTAELGNSIRWRRSGNRDVLITSDKVYAEVHNNGLRAGRGKGFRMPKRQFIGKSDRLNQKIQAKITAHLFLITKT